MTGAWVSLQEAVETVRAGSDENPAEVIRRAVSAALLMPPGALPPPGHTPPVIRVRVILQQRRPDTEMMDWLQAPVLDFEKSEILCRGFTPESWEEINRPRKLHPARIEIWKDDLLRLWPAGGIKRSNEKPTPAPEPHTRFPLDYALALEGKAGLQSNPRKWPNKHQAALELAERAEGNATIESKVSRIERKISEIL
jgi:hypothetical protein